MTLAPKTFGAEVGDGMSLLANNWVSTQNTLEQQRLKQQQDEADYNFKLRQQQANETYQQGQLGQGQQTIDQQAARDAAALTTSSANKRVTDFATVRTDFDNEKGALFKAYSAAQAAGDSTALQHAKDRLDHLTKLMKAVNLSTQDDASYWPARQALYEFLGTPAQETGGAAPQGQPAVPAPMDMNFPPARTTVARGDAVANGDTAPQGPPSPAAPPAAAPVTSDPARYTDIRQIPIGELVQMDPNALEQQFPGIGSSWWGTHKQAYDTAQREAQELRIKTRVDNWKTQLGELVKRNDLTGGQRIAIIGISDLLNQPSLTPEEEARAAEYFNTLAPVVYTPQHWNEIVASKDDAQIVAQYDMFLAHSPEAVQGFNIEPYRARLNAAVERDAAATALTQSQTVLNDANTNTEDALRPGKVDAQTDTHNESVVGQAATVATTAGTVATTGKTLGDTAATKATTQRDDREAGIKNLTDTFATLDPKLSYYQIGLQMPGLIASTKAALGLTDTGMNNLIREAQYKYGQGIRATDLANQLAGSKVLTDGATRAGIIASTADTLSTTRARDSKLQPELNLLNQQIRNAELQGQDTASLIARRNALLPIDVQEGLARAAASRASAASSSASAQKTLTLLPIEAARGWADIGNIQSQVHERNVQTNQDIAAQQGKLDLTQATIAHLGAQTLYERTRTPGDPLYNPAVAAVKPGDPQAALYKQIDQYVKASKTASGLVGTLQNQINAISKKYTTALGTVDLSRITPEDKASLADLTRQRDHQVAVATNRQRSADDLLLKNPPAATPGASSTTAPVTFQQLGGQLGLPTTRRATPYGQMYTINGRPQPHNGEDIFAPPGTPIKAPFTGYVSVKHDKETGNELILTDASGQKMLLGHLQGYAPGLQDAITKAGGKLLWPAGKPIGYVGQTGDAAQANLGLGNSHTHVMAYDASGKVVNPLSIQFKGVQKPTTATATNTPPPATPVKVTTGTVLPTGTPKPAVFKPNTGLESGLTTAIKTSDPNGVQSYGDALIKAGYSQAQVLALIKKARGG